MSDPSMITETLEIKSSMQLMLVKNSVVFCEMSDAVKSGVGYGTIISLFEDDRLWCSSLGYSDVFINATSDSDMDNFINSLMRMIEILKK